MNEFNKTYLNIINEWNSNILLEATLKSLIPNIQQELLQGKEYKDLNNDEKEILQSSINDMLNHIEKSVNEITNNKQYQSWIYNILKNKEVELTDLTPIKSVLISFINLCKRPDLKPKQRNIQNYSSLTELRNFINSFKSEHKLDNYIYHNLKKIYSNKEFTVYFINKDQYEECKKLFGGEEYFNTGWCIAKNEDHFNDYLINYILNSSDKFNGYFVFIKDNKPYALLHYGSGQFKDTSDESLIDDNPNIIDCLLHINNNIHDYTQNDLQYYGKQLFMQENPKASKEEWIAFEIGGEYIKETNTIDCKGNRVFFKDEWLDENGTFDFKITNAISCNAMFSDCTSLKKLPDDFTIPEGVKDCFGMFNSCYNLEELPDNFIIPEGVLNCNAMFEECHRLKKLPNNFKLPSTLISCNRMFEDCQDLIQLPNNFTLPTNVKHCTYMFNFCKKLRELPNSFILPAGLSECIGMFANCYMLNKLPDNFTIPDNVINCRDMFNKCYCLTVLPKNFTIPENAMNFNIFFDSGLRFKYKVTDLIK